MPQPARPASTRHPAAPAAISPALAARVRQLAAQAEHRRAVAEFRARRAGDQQARIDALLLEAIAALASLLGAPDHSRPATAQPGRHAAPAVSRPARPPAATMADSAARGRLGLAR
jgi:hypothetical protein